MLTTNLSSEGNRVIFLDYLRVLACFMVIIVHSCEFFYLGTDSCLLTNDDDRFWVSLIDGSFRISVPLFVMASAYLLVPLKTDSTTFFKRRFTRVVIPFVIWSVLYATLPVLYGDLTVEGMKESLQRLLYNFNMSSGHLWFVYMLISLYMIMPILSPWLQQVGKRGEQLFLLLWFLSTFHHTVKEWVGDGWFGECFWNEFHILWYFSGHIGYLVMAHYIRTHLHWSWAKSLRIGSLALLAGTFYTIYSFYTRTQISNDPYTFELYWRFCTPNVAIATFGCFVMLKHITFDKPWLYRPILSISKLSYGIYLMHIFLLNFSYKLIHGSFSVPVEIGMIGLLTIAACCVTAKLISYLPGHKYIIG